MVSTDVLKTCNYKHRGHFFQSRGRSATTTKVFVGSLPPDVSPDDLKKLFNPYGPIAECDIANRCGFLHLEDQTLAEKAITELNGVEFMGGKISVEKGRVKPRRSGGGGGGGGGGGPRGGRDRGGPYSRGIYFLKEKYMEMFVFYLC